MLPRNIIATGYENLQLISTITGDPLFCNSNKDDSSVSFYEDGACIVKDSTDDYRAVCEETGNAIIFTLTIKTPLSQNVNFGVDCVFPETIRGTIVIQVQGTTIFEFAFFFICKSFQIPWLAAKLFRFGKA